MSKEQNKIGTFRLAGIIISAIVGAGIFNLMKEMASTASAGVNILGWIVAGIGIGSLALCMVNLSQVRPDLNAGIFSYAKEGFGDYLGFNSVWGYWISVIIGNVAFGTLLFSALGYFFPVFGNGQNIASIIGASVVLWIMHVMIVSGLDKATLLNTIVLIAKLVPITIFIVIVIAAFNKGIFIHDFWGLNSRHPMSILAQLKGTMLSTMWVFIGVEGAVVFSGRAKHKKDVGKATIIGFTTVALIYAAVTIFSYGIMSRAQLAKLPNPAMAYVLEAVIGKPGAIIINIGVIITVFGAWIANTLLAEEVAFQAGKQGLFPKYFAKENKHHMPGHSMLITDILVQILLLSFLITSQAYSFLSQLSSAAVLLSYTLVALFQVKETYLTRGKYRQTFGKNMFIGILTTIYMFWMIYASGTSYILLTILTLIPGTIIYAYVRHNDNKQIFTKYEWLIFAIFMILFVIALIKLPQLIA